MHKPIVLHTLPIVACRSGSLGRGHAAIVGRGHGLLLLENAVLGITARLLHLRAVVFLLELSGCFLGRVWVLRLHVMHLRLLVHRISGRGS